MFKLFQRFKHFTTLNMCTSIEAASQIRLEHPGKWNPPHREKRSEKKIRTAPNRLAPFFFTYSPSNSETALKQYDWLHQIERLPT